MLSDIRYAVRQLGKSPGFTTVAVLTLALGIGATTAIFSVIHSALLRPLPYAEPEQLVEIWTTGQTGARHGFIHAAKFKQIRDHVTSFSAAAASFRHAFNFIDRGGAERVWGLEVSANYLPTLRREPALGRNFDPDSDRVGGENHVVILAHEWWKSRFGGDPAIVGRTINLNDASYTVLGVLPPHVLLKDDIHFLTPLLLDVPAWRQDPESDWLGTVLRLRPGVTLAQAEQEVNTLSLEVDRRLLPLVANSRRAEIRPLQSVLTETTRPTLLLLLGAVALVLLIACANVANLLLARASSRRREMAVRSALGASGARIVRLMLAESLVLALLGGVVGVLLASFGVEFLDHAIAGVLPSSMQPTIDLSVLAFSVVVASGTGVLFGLFPALQARRVDVNRALKQSCRASSGARSPAQSLLIVTQVALTAILLIGGGLLLRSFARVLGVEPGFEPRHALVADLALTESSFRSNEEILHFEHALVQRLETLPGVAAAGLSSTLPLSGETWAGPMTLPDLPPDQQPFRGGTIEMVAGHYFAAMGIALRQGRVFAPADNTLDAPKVAVINQRLADDMRLPPGESPIGRRIRVRQETWEIVGVVDNVRYWQLDRPAPRRVYLPNATSPTMVRLIVRTHVAPFSLSEDVQRTVIGLNAAHSIANVRTLEQTVGRSLQDRRVALVLIGFFAAVALALALACIGIYGVMAYTIGQRERELSIHLALGAQRRAIVAMVLRDGLRLGAAGIVIGLLAGLAGAGFIASRLYEVTARDPLVFTTVGVFVALVTFVAVLLPARRATKVDPMIALRAE